MTGWVSFESPGSSIGHVVEKAYGEAVMQSQGLPPDDLWHRVAVCGLHCHALMQLLIDAHMLWPQQQQSRLLCQPPVLQAEFAHAHGYGSTGMLLEWRCIFRPSTSVQLEPEQVQLDRYIIFSPKTSILHSSGAGNSRALAKRDM